MKQKVLVLLTVLMFPITLWAAEVDREWALSKAQAFLRQQGRDLVLSDAETPVTKARARGERAADTYFVFNAGKDKGFVIVSGDDSTPAILGYADSGSFDINSLPPAMEALLQHYAAQIERIQSGKAVASPRRSPHATVAELMTVKWNQGNPYNMKTPHCYYSNMDDPQQCATGCVATTMAQVLYHQRFVNATQAEIPGYNNKYSWQSPSGTKTATLATIPAGSALDWGNMVDSYNGSETDAQKEAVANLMLYCGTAVNMAYSFSSSASITDIPNALKTYFGYSRGVCHVDRSRYTDTAWDNLIYNEIAAGRPVIYGGLTESNSGHAFIVHGYNNGLYAINWGWGGYQDNYFLLDNLTPDDQGIGGGNVGEGYNFSQEAVIGLAKEDGSFSEQVRLTTEYLELGDQNVFTKDGSQFLISFKAKFMSHLANTYNISYNYAIYKDGTFMEYMKPSGAIQTFSFTPDATYFPAGEIQIYLPYVDNNSLCAAFATPGVYKIVPVSKEENGDVWNENDGSDIYFLTAVVTDDNTLTLYVGNPDTDPAVRTIHVETAGTLSSLISDAEKYQIEELTLTGNLNGTDFRLIRDMAGNDYLGQPTEGNLKKLDLYGANIVASGEKYLDTEKVTSSTGTYTRMGGDFFHFGTQDNMLGNSIFAGCDKLEEVILPRSITSIGTYVFWYCLNLKSIAIAENVSAIGADLVFGPNKLTNISVAEGNQTFSTPANSNVVMQGTKVFLGFGNPTFPAGTTIIGNGAFSNSSSLGDVVIPEGVTTIECGAFAWSSLSSISFPNSLTTIENDTFAGCYNLTSFTLPKTVTHYGDGLGALKDCGNLTSISVEAGNPVYDSRDNCNAIIETSTNTLISGCQNTVIPNSVTILGHQPFRGMPLSDYVIPSRITTIGEMAFFNAGMTSVTIPSSVTYIGEYAFSYCYNLKTVISYIEEPFAISRSTFSGISADAVLHVPYGKKAAYLAADGWKDAFAEENIVEMNNDVATGGMKNLYKQDHESVSMPNEAGWMSPNLAGGMSIITDTEGSAFQFDLGSNNNRNAVLDFNYGKDNGTTIFDGQDVKKYTINFTWGLVKNPESMGNAANVQYTSEIAILSGNWDRANRGQYVNNGQYAANTSLCLFSITQLKGAYSDSNPYWTDRQDNSNYTYDFYISNDREQVVTLEQGGWYKFTINVDTEARTIDYKIFSQRQNIVLKSGSYAIPEECDAFAKGLNVFLGRYNSIAQIDDVKILQKMDGDYANKPTVALTNVNMAQRTYKISFEEGETLHVKNTEGSEVTITQSPYIYTTETSGTLDVWTESGSANSEHVMTEVEAEVIQLPAAQIDVTMIRSGYEKTLRMRVDNSGVPTQPEITMTWTYSNGDKSGSPVIGAIYEAKEKGTLTVTTHANGFGESTVTFDNSTEYVLENIIDFQHMDDATLTAKGFTEIDPLQSSILSGENNWSSRQRLWFGIENGGTNGDGTPAYDTHVVYGPVETEGEEPIRRFTFPAASLTKQAAYSLFAPVHLWYTGQDDPAITDGSDVAGLKVNYGIGLINTGTKGDGASINYPNGIIGVDGLTDEDYYVVYFVSDYGISSKHPIYPQGTSVADGKAMYKADNIGDGTNVRILRGKDKVYLYRISDAISRIEVFKPKSNTDNNGNIHVATAGTLSTLLTGDPMSITELTITGNLNGTDFRLLREMAGHNYLGKPTNGKLSKLDLSGATIVTGGDNYLDTDQLQFGYSTFSNGRGYHLSTSDNAIGDYLFFGCEKLTEIKLPAGVTSIGGSAFEYCKNLRALTIPKTVTSMGSSVISECDQLSSLTVEAGNTVFSSPSGSNVVLRGTTLVLGCKTSIIPDNITAVGSNAFFGFHGFAGDNGTLTLPSGVTVIDSYAFADCSFSTISLPEGLKSIQWSAFARNSNLKSIVIPASVETIGRSILEGCTGLESVVVASGNTRYDSRDNCNAIIETATNKLIEGFGITNIPLSVTTIGVDAYYQCLWLTDLVIPEHITTIEERAFWNCQRIAKITSYMKTPPTITVDVFFNLPSTTKLYVPYGTKATYLATDGWKDVFSSDRVVEMEPRDEPTEEEPTDISTLANAIYIDKVKALVGSDVDVLVKFKNVEPASGYQFNLVLPTGVSVAKDEYDDFEISKTSRHRNGHSVAMVAMGTEGVYKVIAYSTSNTPVSEGDGAVISLKLHIADNMEAGTYPIRIQDAIYTTPEEKQYNLESVMTTLTIDDYILGDANGDGVVNVTDVVSIVNYILGKPNANFSIAAADVNGDGSVNVTDVVCVVNIILGKTNNARAFGDDEMTTENDQLMLAVGEDQTLSLSLDNTGRYVAAQFDVRLGDGQTLESVCLNAERRQGHQLSWSALGNNVYRVVVYGMGGNAFKGNSGELLTIATTGEGSVAIENITFVTDRLVEKTFAPLSAGTTGIKTILTLDTPADIYDMNGRIVRKDATGLKGLRSGTYLVNGRKVLVK